MPKYMLLLRHHPSAWSDLPPADSERIMGRYMSWGGELAAEGRSVTAEELDQASSVLLTSSDPDSAVADSTDRGTDQSVSGFWLISAADRDDAIRAARGCPGFLHGGTIELFEVIDHGD
jgi:hypothetical protein